MTTMTETATQVYCVFIRATPEQIWEAITKPEFTRRYFHGSNIESTFRVGDPYPPYASLSADEIAALAALLRTTVLAKRFSVTAAA